MTDRLTRVANKRSDVVGKYWKTHLLMACHNAVLLWLFEAEYNKSLKDAVEFASVFAGKYVPTQIMSLIAKKGKKVPAPSGGAAVLKSGHVLVFVDGEGVAGHSCVSWNHKMIIGYNQLGWFKTPGEDHGFSVHKPADLDWVGSQVRANGSKLYTLMAVPEDKARKLVRAAVSRSAVEV